MALLTSRQNTFFLRHALTYLPRDYTPSDGSRMLLGYFTVAGLDLLDILDGPSTKVTSDDRHGLIDWIYRLQLPTGGFRGFTGTDLLDQADDEGLARVWDPANVPSTFFALMALLALGDDLVRVKRRECLEWLPGVQRVDDGSFGEVVGEGGRVEGGRDARPCCCAAGIRYVLRGEDERGIEGVRDIDVEGLIGYIRDSQVRDLFNLPSGVVSGEILCLVPLARVLTLIHTTTRATKEALVVGQGRSHIVCLMATFPWVATQCTDLTIASWLDICCYWYTLVSWETTCQSRSKSTAP